MALIVRYDLPEHEGMEESLKEELEFFGYVLVAENSDTETNTRRLSYIKQKEKNGKE